MFINCKGNLIDFSSPKVMGIINITPDSFFSGSRSVTEKEILLHAEKQLREGADFLDLGAYSSRPGAAHISIEDEVSRMLPAVELLQKEFPEALLSIDTFRAEVAKRSLIAGAAMINDISAGSLDEKMLQTIAEFQVPYIMMHMKGSPQTMKDLNQYNNITEDVLFYFSQKIKAARDLGINDLIIDPGFGFAKDTRQNYELFSKLELFTKLELPILVGISRKSMIWKVLETSASDALNGTTVLNSLALSKGANLLRVHDVKEAIETVKIFKELTN